jgi:pimeloyl-ACP methyl ester carboxylesterase
MEREFHFFHYQQAALHYSVYGSGSKFLFCFHGYGLTGQVFYELEEVLSKEYTIYNFDLFFHGKSEWKAIAEPISKEFWKELINAFIIEKNISSFSLLGYSIGAKFVWNAVENSPDKIKEIIAIAPDGIINNFWYRLATGNVISRAVFKFMLSNKFIIISFLRTGRWLGIIPSITSRFAQNQLNTAEQRSKVFNTWINFRKLTVAPEILAGIINKNKIPLTIYLGANDTIIRYKTIKPLAERLVEKELITLQAGHANLVSKVTQYLKLKS